MTVPVEGIGMATLYFRIYRVARQTVLPETRSLKGFEMGFVPHIGMQVAPLLTEGVEIGLINRESLRIGFWDKLRLTRDGPYVLRILGFSKTHVIIATNRVAEGLIINIGSDIEVHRASYILYHKAIAARGSSLEIDIPDISTHQSLFTSFLLRSRSLFPELHTAHVLLLLCFGIIKVYLLAFPCLIVALTSVTQPLVKVGSMSLFSRRVADDIHMDSFRLLVPDVECYRSRQLIRANIGRDVDSIGATLFHRLWQLDEKPVVTFAGQCVIRIHRLRLAPDLYGLCGGKGLIISRTNLPKSHLLSLRQFQAFAKHHEGIVAL